MKPAYEIHVGDELQVDQKRLVLDVSINEIAAQVVVQVEDDTPGNRSFWTFGYGEMVDA